MIKKIYVLLILIICFGFANFALADNGVCPFDREMILGSENSSVKELQKFLALDKEVYTGPATGYFGPMTQKGVMAFQQKAGLLPNGRVDLATATVLCQIYLSYKVSEPINSSETLDVSSSCFLRTLNLEVGYFDNPTDEVMQLQRWLADNGFYPEKVFTGYFGPMTKRAVQRFQKSQGIIQTGIVGVKTTEAICGGSSSNYVSSSSSGITDLSISAVDVSEPVIDVGTKTKIRVGEKNISSTTSGEHTTSLFINEREVKSNAIPKLNPGKDVLSIDYDWTCPEKGIYIVKIFVDSKNDLIEDNKFNNVLVFPINCGGVSQDLKYSCSTESGKCEVDASGSMTLSECSKSCEIGDKSLPDLFIKSFSPLKIKLGETLPLKIVERNDGNSKAEKHKYIIGVEYDGKSQQNDAYFNELDAKSEQEASGNWECKAAGVYTVTINVDPDNNISESNKGNNKKVFRIECADENGNVPETKENTGGQEDQSNNSQSGDPADKPDLVVSFNPVAMDKGINDIKIDISNVGKSDITKSFFMKVETVDASGARQQSGDLVEIKGMPVGRGKGINGSFFKEPGFNCDPANPIEIWVTVDSTNVIDEKLENNNSAKVSCGTVKQAGAGGQTPPANDPSKTPSCYSNKDGAELKIASLKADHMKDDKGNLIAAQTIYFSLQGLNAERADNIQVQLMDGNTVLETKNISSIVGCKTSDGYFIYTCKDTNAKKLKLNVSYFGVKAKSTSMEVSFTCGATTDKEFAYCTINKAIGTDGTVRLQQNEMVEFRITGVNTGTAVTWSGNFVKTSGEKAYMSFPDIGRFEVKGVTGKVGDGVASCPNFIAIVGNTGGSSAQKVGLNGSCSLNPTTITMTEKTSTNSQVCLTPYISDSNSKCATNNISYVMTIKVNGSLVKDKISRTSSDKTICLTHGEIQQYLKSASSFSVLPGSYKIEALVEASCKYDGETYYLNKECGATVNYSLSTSGGAGGTLSGSCSVTPSSPKVNTNVNFNVSVSKSGFKSGECSSFKYTWTGCNSSSSSCSTSYSSTGAKTASVKITCSDDSTKSISVNCNVNVQSADSGGYDPGSGSAKTGDLGGTCSCGTSGCNVSITGGSTDVNAYTCTWTVNGQIKPYVTTCRGINASSVTSASVRVYEDKTGKSVTVKCK